jgi:hypothetical protein
VRAEDKIDTLNRSAIVVKPKQPFLDWLHVADPTRRELTCLTPTIYLIAECDTNEDVEEVLNDLWEEIFEEQLAAFAVDCHSLVHITIRAITAST